MDQSNIRDSTSFEENESYLHTMKTIHSLDKMHKTYVPQTVAKDTKPSPSSILKNQNSEIRKNPNCNRPPQARNLDPNVSWTPFKNYETLSPTVHFSSIPTFIDDRNNELLNHPECSAVRIASGQINKNGENCSSFDSTASGGSQVSGLHTNSVSFAGSDMCNGTSPYYSQSPYLCDPGYYFYPYLQYSGYNGLWDHYQQPYLFDPIVNYCRCQQPFGGPVAQVDGCSPSGSKDSRRECSTENSDNDNSCQCFCQDESKSIGSNNSVYGNEEKKFSNPLVFEDYAATSTDGCPLTGCQCHLNATSKQMDIRDSPKASCLSFKRKNRKVRIADDACSKSSQESLRSGGSKVSECSCLETSTSDRGLIMPDLEASCTEPPKNCCECAPSCCQPFVSWDNCYGCNPCPPVIPCNTNQYDCMNYCCMNNCIMNNSCMTCCSINDALQNCTVYMMDYQPIMTASNQQHYGGCCWQDLPLGGGFGPCGGCRPISYLPICTPVDGHRYIPPSATLTTCCRPDSDHFPEDSTGCDTCVCADSSYATNSSM